jgi:hypothetical protein
MKFKLNNDKLNVVVDFNKINFCSLRCQQNLPVPTFLASTFRKSKETIILDFEPLYRKRENKEVMNPKAPIFV